MIRCYGSGRLLGSISRLVDTFDLCKPLLVAIDQDSPERPENHMDAADNERTPRAREAIDQKCQTPERERKQRKDRQDADASALVLQNALLRILEVRFGRNPDSPEVPDKQQQHEKKPRRCRVLLEHVS